MPGAERIQLRHPEGKRAAVDKQLGTKLHGANNWWHIHGVKLHLEAIGELARVGSSRQRLVRSRPRKAE